MFPINAVWIGDVVDGIAGGVEFDALKAGRKEAGSPLTRGDGLGVTPADLSLIHI